jgi:hypothetical protein
MNKIADRFSNLQKMALELNKAATVKWVSIFVLIVIISGMLYYIITKNMLNKQNCDNLDKVYTGFPTISSFNENDEKYSYNLRDYYIKSAYNCCASGQFKNDFVNTCALKKCIEQGARMLDFEIYSVDNEPVIAISTENNFHVKQSYNSVKFDEAMNIVSTYGFSGSTCPNANDPLILHFRIMSSNKDIYTKMADSIYKNLERRILDKTYSYEYYGHNLGAVPLKTFVGKIIIAVDRSNPLFEQTPLFEYVNIASNSIFLRAARNYDIIYTPDMQELIEYNKKNMTFSMPDLGPSDANVQASLHQKYGVQMVGMCFQNFDSNMEYYDLFFDAVGSAFVLKPAPLRFVPLTIPEPTKQNPELSYKERTVESDFYKFNI